MNLPWLPLVVKCLEKWEALESRTSRFARDFVFWEKFDILKYANRYEAQ